MLLYSVASSAATLLQSMGEYCWLGWPNGRGKADRNVLHCHRTERNSAQRIAPPGCSCTWMGSMEIRSQNELTAFGFAKDYDAIVTVRTDIGSAGFAP